MLLANPGAGPRHTVPADLHVRTEPIRAVWLDLVDPSEDERALVERVTGLRVPVKGELAEIETSSRAYQEGDTLYLSTPMAYRADDGTSQVSPLGFVLGRNYLVTVRFAKLPVFDVFADRFALHDGGGVAPCSVSAFVGLLEAIVDRLADVLERVGGDLDRISHKVFRVDGSGGGGGRRRNAARTDAQLRATLRAVGRAGDTLSNIRDSLLGVSRIAHYSAETAHDWTPEALRAHFKTLHQDLTSLGEYDSQLTNKVQFLLDATLGFINIEQNNGIKVLTVVSVVGVPPTLMASIYGMNFKHMPELDWAYGYPYGLAVIVLSAVLPLVWFRWRGWI